MDSAYPRWHIGNVRVIPELATSCPCGASLTRRDTGLCERCTAKLPDQQAAAEQWRQRCILGPARFKSEPLAGDACPNCVQSYEGTWAHHRDFECPSKPVVCDCGRRYENVWDMARHQREARAHRT
jgi:hypothetical protein